MNVLSLLWPRLEHVHASLTDPEARRQSLLLARLLLVLLVLVGISAIIQTTLVPGFRRYLPALVPVLALLVLAYALNYRGRYRAAGMIAVTVMLAGCFGALFLNPQDVLAYAYLAIPLFLARLFLPGILFVTLPVAVIAGVLGVSWLLGGGLTQAVTASVFLATLSIFFAIARQHRVAIEQDRRAALAASEHELRTILDNMQDTYYRTDRDGRVVRASESATQLLGYVPDDVLGMRLADLYSDADGQERFAAALKAAGGSLRNYEVALRHRDGSVIWVSTNAQYVRDADGHVIGVEGTTRDITERKRAEERLPDIARGIAATTGETFFYSLAAHLVQSLHADYAFIGELVAEQPDRIRTIAVQAGDRRADNFEYGLAGTPCQNVVGRETCAYPRAVQEQFPDDRMLAEMGVQAYVGTPLFGSSGAALGLLIVLYRQPIEHDQTIRSTLEIFAARAAAELERTRAEQALRDSEALLAKAQEVAHIGSWSWDIASNDVLWSRETYRLFGVAPETGEHPWRILERVVHPDDRGRLQQAIERTARTGEAQPLEFRLVWADGTEHVLWAEGELLRAPDGRPARMIGTVQDITERKRAEIALAQSESNFRALTENANVGILVNHHGKHVFANNRLLDMLGYTAEEIRATGVKELVHPREYDNVLARFRDRLDGKPAPNTYETVFMTKTGQAVPVELTAAKTTWQGEPAGLVFLHDIRERLRTEEQMRKLSSALEQTADSVLVTDRAGVIEYVNPAFEKTTGYTRAEALGQTPRLVKSGKQGVGFYKKLWDTILAGEVFSEVFVNRRKDGSLYYEEKTISPLKGPAGVITHFVATGKDVTERVQVQERLQHMAQHDALTELPNRVLFLDRLKQSLARARWHQRLVAVLFVDMDRFKTINDTLGHEVGDRLLQALAERFTVGVREGDTVARFGGDEFVILLDDVASEKDIGAVAQKILEALAPPFTIDGQSLYITASIGVSLYPNDGEDSGTLVKNADIAMYRAKEIGKNTYQFYSADMSARAFERLTLESSLRHAIERNEFRLVYQPQIDTASGAILGVEALLRWQHPDFGLVAPAEFIPLLEETGHIVAVGEWVFHTACKQLRAWHAAGWPALRMAVNLSPRQFQTAGLAMMIERGLAATGCAPGLLELEITESVLLQHSPATLDALAALHALGVRLAIDDFGTGYSSLGYLHRYSIDTLKIDRSFVHDVPGDADDSALASAIIVLAQSLKLNVIAEGVETEAQRGFLQERGCRIMQGYLFSRPLPAEDITRLLEKAGPQMHTDGRGRKT
jgi:diguanylate cyclase (GGDEF)-like protein/PAS domain S-box-containing protein